MIRSDDVTNPSPDGPYSEGVTQATINSLWSSFELLPERDRRLLTLRVVKGHSWKEVARIFVDDGIESKYSDALVAKLRKQGERAIEKLRKDISPVEN